MNEDQIKIILNQYSLGQINKISPISCGLINQTFLIETDSDSYIAQLMNKMYPPVVTEEYDKIQEYLAAHNFNIPKLVKTRTGQKYCFLKEQVFRIFNYVAHDSVDYSMINNSLANQLGQAWGQLQRLLSQYLEKPTFKLKNFHETRSIIEKLKAVNSANLEKSSAVENEYAMIVRDIENLYFSEPLANTVIHGDPKIFNLLIKNNQIVSVVDWDGIIWASPLLELGDALRDWCQKDMIRFDFQVYNSAVEGYLSQYDLAVRRSAIAQATKLITLELAARFLTDYFEENYFSWDKIRYLSAAEHNLQRTRDCLAYYQDMCQYVK